MMIATRKGGRIERNGVRFGIAEASWFTATAKLNVN